MTVASMATSAVDSMIPMRTGPRSDRKPTPDDAPPCSPLTAPRLGRRRIPAAGCLPPVLLADQLPQVIEVRRGAVGPPREPDRHRRGVADRPVDHARTAVLGGGGLG